MRANHDTGHQPLGAPDMYPTRETGWAPPRDDSTSAKDSLAEIIKNRVIRFDSPLYPLEPRIWPAEVGENGMLVNPSPDSNTTGATTRD